VIAARRARASAKYSAVAVPMAAGSLFLFVAPASPAAATVTAVHGGAATIARPGATATGALGSGGSSTPFTVVLPANASCSGDTAHDGDHVYSYLVPRGTALSTVTFIGFPSKGYGLVGSTGRYYGAVNTAVDTGQIIGIPNDFVWGKLVKSDGGAVALTTLVDGPSHGVWEAGIACATTHGRLADHWNTPVTFTADARDAHGLAWHAVPGAATVSSSLPAAGTADARTPGSAAATAAGTGIAAHGATAGAGPTGDQGAPAGSGAVPPVGGSGSDGSGGATAVTDVPVAAAACAGAFALALVAGLLALVRRNRRAGPTPAAGRSVR
jgi:hypothetical protein